MNREVLGDSMTVELTTVEGQKLKTAMKPLNN